MSKINNDHLLIKIISKQQILVQLEFVALFYLVPGLKAFEIRRKKR